MLLLLLFSTGSIITFLAVWYYTDILFECFLIFSSTKGIYLSWSELFHFSKTKKKITPEGEMKPILASILLNTKMCLNITLYEPLTSYC